MIIKIQINDKVVKVIKKIFTKRNMLIALAVLLAGTTFFLFADELEIPFIFKPGAVISSYEMNENFEKIAENNNKLWQTIENLQIAEGYKWFLDGDDVYYGDGNVRIQKDDPWLEFHELQLPTSYFYRIGVSNNGIFSIASDDNGTWGAGTDTRFLIGNDGNVAITESLGVSGNLAVNGNVGIGTATPGEQLHLYDSAIMATAKIEGTGAGYNAAELVLQSNFGHSSARGTGVFFVKTGIMIMNGSSERDITQMNCILVIQADRAGIIRDCPMLQILLMLQL